MGSSASSLLCLIEPGFGSSDSSYISLWPLVGKEGTIGARIELVVGSTRHIHILADGR
jgi:hypothetical protein